MVMSTESLDTDIPEDGRMGRTLRVIIQQLPGLDSLWDICSQTHMSLQDINFFSAEGVI